MVRITCEWCGNIIIGRKKRFCDRLCQNRFLTSNKSDSTRAKLSEKFKGKPLSDDHLRKIRESYTEEVRSKMSESHTGKTHSESTKSKISKSNLGKVMSEESRSKISESKKGKSPWNKGLSTGPLSDSHKYKLSEAHKLTYEDYQYDPNKPQPEYRRKAIETYGYVCSGCGFTDGVLQVHHLDGNHYNDNIENLAVLCISCHNRIHPHKFKGDPTPDREFTQYILENRNINQWEVKTMSKYYQENGKLKCYNAGPWFRPDQDERNTWMKQALEDLGFNVFDPRTANLVPEDADQDWRKTAFEGNVGAIREADFLVVTTDGLDSGTIFEAGMAYQAGVPIIYFAETLGDRQFNLMLAQSGIHVVLSRDQFMADLANKELIQCIKEKKVFKNYVGKVQ